MVKNKILRFVSLVGLLLGLLALPVKAQDVGIAIGVYGISSTFETEGTETENPGASQEIQSTIVSKDVDFGSIFAEVNVHEGWFGSAIGIEYVPGAAEIGAKSRTDITTDATEANQDDSTYTAKAEISDHFSAYIEPTIYLTGSSSENQFGIYAKGGVSRVTVNTLESISSGTDSSSYGDKTVYGGIYGLGLRAKHSSGLLLKAEWTQTRYGKVELESTTGNKNKIEADTDQDSFRIAIGYQF